MPEAEPPAGPQGSVTPSKRIAVVAVFGALIAVGTFFSIPLPAPLYEITWSPAIYFALAALVDIPTSASAVGIGSFIGEALNISLKGGGSPIYPFGIVWARVPEAAIIGWARHKGRRALVASMVLATVFETLAFFFPDWLFYTYGLFQYGAPTSFSQAFALAAADFGTLVDLAYIPVGLTLIRVAGPAFRRLGFS